tara:strand:+ start:3180 stop:4124 length:945 start_codon:yes stop_codon:yes gene_type:complete
MTTETIPVTDKQSWLQARLHDITSTEVSALYDLSPYRTEFDLYQEKRNQTIVEISDNERMRWGRNLESAIAHGAAEDMGWDISKFDVYMRNENRLGSSFDYKIHSVEDGDGILEIKNVDAVAYRNNWKDDGVNIEGPEHIELQIQHQMEVANLDWTALVCLVGGNTQKIIYRDRDRQIGNDITEKVKAFWNRVDAGTPPKIDYLRDADYIIKKLRNQAEAGVILAADEDMDKLVDEYNTVSREYYSLGKTKDAIKAQILDLSQNASKIISANGTISCGMSKESKGKLITQDMVGQYVNPRKSYRMFRFNSPKSN